MRPVNRGSRAEPPLTAPVRVPQVRAEPPLTAAARPAAPVSPAVAAPREAVSSTFDRLPRPAARRDDRLPQAPRQVQRAADPDDAAMRDDAVEDEAAGRPLRLRFPIWRRESAARVEPESLSGTLRRSAPVRDPAPSRLAYRMHRIWLTPLYRALFRVGMPAFALAMGVGLYLSDDDRREALRISGAELIRSVQERPEFMVNLMVVEGASPAIADEIRAAVPVDFPLSSFDLDLEAMRDRVAEIDAVAAAELRVRPGGILEIRITERVPAVLWRGPDGLFLLDDGGNRVARAASRTERPDLPVIAGDGADAAVPEALHLIGAAAPVALRLRGLVRMGERRWDVVLDNGQRILLPEEGALVALERVMALAGAEDMLARDVTVVDMRNGARPTLRLTQHAVEAMRRGREIETGATNG